MTLVVATSSIHDGGEVALFVATFVTRKLWLALHLDVVTFVIFNIPLLLLFIYLFFYACFLVVFSCTLGRWILSFLLRL